MRGWNRLLLVATVLSLVACSRDGSATGPDSTSTDPNLGDLVSQPGLFSYQAPKGWTVQENPELDYATCVGPGDPDGSTLAMQTNSQGYQSVADYVKAATADASHGKIVDQGPFTTRAGVTGECLLGRNGSQEYVIYTFAGKSGLLLTFTGTCPAAKDAQFHPLFDASIKSLTLEKE